jgi:hypothetical protein
MVKKAINSRRILNRKDYPAILDPHRDNLSVQIECINSRLRVPCILWLAFVIIFTAPGITSAATVVINPIKDNTLFEPEAEKSNGSGVYIYSGNTDDKGVRRALLAFDVAGNVPAGVTIESASLTLRVSKSAPGSGSQTHTLHTVDQDWGEGASDAGDPGGDGTSAEDDDATWIYRFYDKNDPESSPAWTIAGGDFSGLASASQSVGGNGVYTWSSGQMATDVQGWLDSPSTNFGWLVKGNEGQLKTAKRFDSRENSNASRRPQLSIVYGQPSTPPDVTINSPNGGETVTANSSTPVNWSASDESGIASIDLYISDDDGTSYRPIALGLANTPPYTWFPANRPTTLALIKIVATDITFVSSYDESDAVFTIESPTAGLTTLRDFDMPGTQPHEADTLNDPSACVGCHGDYDKSVEPYSNWQGSMMAQASYDPLFRANMVIANQDAPDSGDLCLRCHFSRGWLDGRSVPTDGTAMLPEDHSGLSCDLCHRMLDPISDPENPSEDTAILAALSFPGTEFGNGMFVVDPVGARRGPFFDADGGHPILVSPFHREAALCGTCHDVSNPAFEWDAGSGKYLPNAEDAPATDFSPQNLLPVERTYSEWLNSAFNSQDGVYSPYFGGNKTFVATCQDCHMPDVTGYGCNFGSPPERDDLPLHDLTGGSTWLPTVLSTMYPVDANDPDIVAGADRALYMLEYAADLDVSQLGKQLAVTVTNNTGHKLPTGYPEGRRMWLNIKFYDESVSLIAESGAYDTGTGVLTEDDDIRAYRFGRG